MKKRLVKFGLVLDKDSRFPCVVKEQGALYEYDGTCGPKQITDICRSILCMDVIAEEHLYLFCLDGSGAVKAVSEVSHGTADASLVNPSCVLQRALLSGAVSIIIAHNHPSGDVTPSRADQITTRRMMEASDLIGIPLLDHVIVGPDSFYSFRECQSDIWNK